MGGEARTLVANVHFRQLKMYQINNNVQDNGCIKRILIKLKVHNVLVNGYGSGTKECIVWKSNLEW